MGGSETFIMLASFAAVSSVGVGGNIPVDSAVFLGAFARITDFKVYLRDAKSRTVDFIPSSHQYLLTILSIWWTIGQLIGSLVSSTFSSPFPLFLLHHHE